jgi:hypothetical protein
MIPTALGEFQLVIYPPTEPIYPEEMFEISGMHQLIPGNSFLEKILPKLWISQYTIIEVIEKPEWLSVSIPSSALLTNPDGEEYPFDVYISLTENAPMNTTGTVELSLMTGKFMRTLAFISDRSPLSKEFEMDQSFQIKTGIWEDDSIKQNDTDDNESEYKPEKLVKGWTIKYVTDLAPQVEFYLRGEEYTSQLVYFFDRINKGISDDIYSFENAIRTDMAIELLIDDTKTF